MEVVANFFGALVMVPSFSAMLFVRHRILVQLRRTEQRMRSVDRSILRVRVLLLKPVVLRVLLGSGHSSSSSGADSFRAFRAEST